MNVEVTLQLPESEAKALYRLLHLTDEGQEVYCEAYRQLQGHFFRSMTVDQVTALLERDR